MKASEARHVAVKSQVAHILGDVKKAAYDGRTWTHTYQGQGALFPETAEELAELGFDVKVVKRADDSLSTNLVSWANAEDNRRGTVEFVEEAGEEPA